MLSMLFKEKLTEEEDRYLFDKFLGYPMQFLHDICEIDTKVNVYFGDVKLAGEASQELKAKGFKFISHVHSGKPFFHPDFTDVDDQTVDETPDAQHETTNNISFGPQPSENFQSPTRKPDVQMINRPVLNRVKAPLSPTPSYSPPPAPVLHPQPEYVTMAQFLELSNKTKHFSMDMTAKVDAISASYALSNGMMHDHSSYSAPPMNPPPPMNSTSSQIPKSSEFKAKNELLANGICCEKCNKNIKGIEPITKLIMAVREHVMEHFDNENPLLKRFQCRECKEYRTNFVDDFEKHLKRHGSMMSLTERRQKLCNNLCTPTHLKIISELCDKCFPGVFEKEPPALNTIHAVDTPVKAKTSVFPRLDRLYCSKYNIPYSCSGRTVHPVLRID